MEKLKIKFLNNLLNTYIRLGKIKRFDEAFYNRLDNLYFGGLPVYDYIKKKNNHECYNVSKILALAMDGSYLVRGELKLLTKAYDEYFNHGWVEKDGVVYDTTFHIILDRNLYNKIFKVKTDIKTLAAEHFPNDRTSNWQLHTKEYYENGNNHFLEYVAVRAERDIQQAILDYPNSSVEDREYAKKLLKDLPKMKTPNYSDVQGVLSRQ